MPTRRHYRRPNPDRRRALELLAGSHHGYSKAILRAHGFSMDMMVELVKAGLATTKRERMVDRRSTDRRCARADYGRWPASARKDVQVSPGQLFANAAIVLPAAPPRGRVLGLSRSSGRSLKPPSA
jgi:hypothetical protein